MRSIFYSSVPSTIIGVVGEMADLGLRVCNDPDATH